MMKIYLVYFTAAGQETCRKIGEALEGQGHCCESSDGRRLPGGLSLWTQEAFTSGEALVFVSAAGIAVRAIAPFVRSKTTDPAVIVTDERGGFVISLLSGHIGGANELALSIAETTGGQAVITTATDVNGLFAVDQWAKSQDLHIWDMSIAKEVSAAMLRGQEVGLWTELPVEGEVPRGLTCRGRPQVGIAVAAQRHRSQPFEKTLWLTPKDLVLGIGCRRGVSRERIAKAVKAALESRGLCLEMAACVASIDLKKDEEGLVSFARELGVPFVTYDAKTLEKAQLENGFSPSGFVKSVTGVDNVCERAAVICAGEGREALLLMEKQAGDGVTVAAAVKKQERRLRWK